MDIKLGKIVLTLQRYDIAITHSIIYSVSIISILAGINLS